MREPALVFQRLIVAGVLFRKHDNEQHGLSNQDARVHCLQVADVGYAEAHEEHEDNKQDEGEGQLVLF